MTLTQLVVDEDVARGHRIQYVRLALAVPLRGNVTAKDFGELIAKEEGRKPYDKATPTRWEKGSEPSLSAVAAMARIAQRHGLLFVSRAWLAFGNEGVVEAREAPAAPASVEEPVATGSSKEPTPVDPSIVQAAPRAKKGAKRTAK